MEKQRKGNGRLDEVEALYGEDISLDFESELANLVTNLWGASRSVDWKQGGSSNVSPAEQEILTDLAMQFSYNNVAELKLCGTILADEYFLQPKMIASIIAVSKLRNIETWNQYLGHTEQLADIPEPEREYFGALSERESTDSILLGMSVIGKITWKALTEEVNDIDDPVFQQIIDQIQDQKDAKLELIRNHLRDRIDVMTADERQELHSDARHYRGLARETILYHDSKIRAVDRDPQNIADHVEDAITTFYNEIGLDM